MKKVVKKIALLLIAFGIGVGVTLLYTNNKYKVYEEENPKQIKKHVDTISMMLETEANSGNYEMTTRDSWPTEGYIFNTELSKCENGGELSWDNTTKQVLMSGNVSDKCYVYFDMMPPILLADYVKSLYTGTQGENSIYYHDASLTNGAGDNSYRYAGASSAVNNFVCFGTNTTPCPTDNLYRIIGVFGDQVKLIKYDYATSALLGTEGDYYGTETPNASYYKGSLTTIDTYYWNSSTQKNTWSESLLNKTNLNANFIANIGSGWAKKIATTTWKVGGNTNEKISYVIPSIAYQNEINNPAPGSYSTTGEINYEAQIGLMYVSDYGYAASPSAWSKTLNSYNGNDDNGAAIKTINWLYFGSYEWTISRNADDTYYAFSVFSTGNVYYSYVDYDVVRYSNGVRPSFYLLSSITYVSGDGTQNSPIIIN